MKVWASTGYFDGPGGGGYMIRAVAVLATLVLSLGACSSLEHGTVVDKTYTEEIMTLIPVYSGSGQFIMVPSVQPECWALHLRDGDETGAVCVDHGTWDRVPEGDTW